MEAELVALKCPHFMQVLEDRRFVSVRVRITFEDNEHTGFTDSSVANCHNAVKKWNEQKLTEKIVCGSGGCVD
jgi:hypothetical protein